MSFSTDPEHIAISKSKGIKIDWKDGKLASATIKNVSGNGHCKACYGDKVVELILKDGEIKSLNDELK